MFNSLEEVYELWPEITQEEVDARRLQRAESKRQSIRDQIADLETKKAALETELQGLEAPTADVAPSEEAQG